MFRIMCKAGARMHAYVRTGRVGVGSVANIRGSAFGRVSGDVGVAVLSRGGVLSPNLRVQKSLQGQSGFLGCLCLLWHRAG